MVHITIVTGAYKPTYNWGASHCRNGMMHDDVQYDSQMFGEWDGS